MRRVFLLCVVGASMGASGCGAPREVVERDSAYKIAWMKKVADEGKADQATLRKLVDELENIDPAVRFYCIRTLTKLTGEDHGYIYYADEEQREIACARWREWLYAKEGGDRADARGSRPGRNREGG